MSTPQSQTKITTSTGNNPLLARAYALSYGDTNTARALYDEWAAQFDADMADTSRDYVAPAIAATTLLSTLIKIYSSSTTSPNSSQPSSPSRSESDPTSSPPAEHHHHATTITSPQNDQITSLSLPETLSILDAGCGTGLAGQHLSTTLTTFLSTPTTTNTKVSIDGIDLSPKMLEIARTKSVYRNLATADLSVPLPTQQFPNETYDAIVCVGTLTHGHVGPHAIAEFVRLVKKEKGVVVATVLGDIYVENGYRDEVVRLEKEGEVEVLSERLEEYRRADGVKANMVVLRRK